MRSKLPICPWCAKPMSHVRTTPTAGGDPHKHHYECKRCIVCYTELDRFVGKRPERARKLDREPIHTLQ